MSDGRMDHRRRGQGVNEVVEVVLGVVVLGLSALCAGAIVWSLVLKEIMMAIFGGE